MILKLCESFLTFTHLERWPSWSKAHDWKSCIPHKGIEGSNPSLSAKSKKAPLGCFFVLLIRERGIRRERPAIGRQKTIQ